jgi:hypothetical protein
MPRWPSWLVGRFCVAVVQIQIEKSTMKLLE